MRLFTWCRHFGRLDTVERLLIKRGAVQAQVRYPLVYSLAIVIAEQAEMVDLALVFLVAIITN